MRPFGLTWRAIAIVFALLSVSLAGNLNGNIVNIAYPAMMLAYQVSFDVVVWIGIGVTLGVTAFLPIGGRLGDLYGYRRMYIIGTAIFVASCAVGALDLPFWPLVLARVVQGLGSAALMPAILAIMARDFPIERRGEMVGLWALAGGLGSTLAPSLGGWFVTNFGWHTVFFAALPVLTLALVVGWWCIPTDPIRPRRAFGDATGAGLLAGALVCGLLALQQLARPAIPMAFAITAGAAILLLALFIVRERRVVQPFLPPALFGVRGFVPVVIIAHLQMLTLGAIVALTPVYLITVHQLSAQTAGLILLPLPMALLASAWFGNLSERVGTRPLLALGCALIGVQTLLATLWSADTPVLLVTVQLGLAGLGMALVQTPAVAFITRSVPTAHVGVATGFVNMARYLGLGVGPSLAAFALALTNGAGDTSGLSGSLAPAFAVVALAATVGAVLSFRVPADPTRNLEQASSQPMRQLAGLAPGART